MALLDMFARSPFKPLQEHMRTVQLCVLEVVPLFEALCAGETERLRELQQKIDVLEGEADTKKNEIREHLPKRLFLPVDRRDLLEMLDMQDSIADTAQDIAGLLNERDMSVPESLQYSLMELVRSVAKACQQAGAVIEKLDELVEMGFRGREADHVLSMIVTLGNMESETDRLGATLTRELFKLEGEMSPVSIMLWYQMSHWIGDLADYAEKCGNRLRLLVAT
ncbi:MAG: TIGR00153 family protein [bacterium]|nr:TIGR00153 family protein [bacterium]